MKTKIIYISGAEVFDMRDIRAAFDTVRTALSLDNDTVLFGVPVDTDDAFVSDTTLDTHMETVVKPVNTSEPEQPTKPNDLSIVSVSDNIATTNEEIDMPAEKPKKTTRHTRTKVIPITPVDSTPDSIDEHEKNTDETQAVPILSVLGAKTESVHDENDITPINITPQKDNVEIQSETQSVTIGDMLADDTTPVDEHEKTLEELLESMTPLGEDEKIAQPQVTEPEPMVEKNVVQSQATDDDTDATLELLATEFAESADKIVAPAKPETRGKIGKLKNILPFKKAKRDDSGIMGDLFGWAGVANDEDFTIPGFFANAKK